MSVIEHKDGHVAELADAQDLGSCGEIHVGSTPIVPTKIPSKSEKSVIAVPFPAESGAKMRFLVPV